jgi:hypothetical protein
LHDSPSANELIQYSATTVWVEQLYLAVEDVQIHQVVFFHQPFRFDDPAAGVAKRTGNTRRFRRRMKSRLWRPLADETVSSLSAAWIEFGVLFIYTRITEPADGRSSHPPRPFEDWPLQNRAETCKAPFLSLQKPRFDDEPQPTLAGTLPRRVAVSSSMRHSSQ